MCNHDQPVGKQWGWYSSVSGIWQTVFVEPRAENNIQRFEITTDIDKSQVRFKVFVSGGTDLLVHITSPTGEKFTERLMIHNGVADKKCRLGSVTLWDPNAPHLYRVKFTLRDDFDAPDVVHGYFGMRSLAAIAVAESGAPGTLSLNGEPIYLRGALYQSYHPEGVYTAGDIESIQDDITCAKRAGFDLLRIHIKVDDPLVLYYADTMGILIMSDLPNFGEGGDTDVGRRRYETMMRRTIERDFNHPSIVAWCLFNETWGFGGQSEFVKLINPSPPNGGKFEPRAAGEKLSNEQAHAWVQSMWQLAKSLDPTRLIEDMSVVAWDHLEYYGHGNTDVNSWHFYSDNYEKARRQIKPLINSEYGGAGALDGDVDTSWSFKFLTNELRLHGKLSAYIYTELHDVEWERNGFLNYDRTPKEFGYDPTIVNQGDVLPIDAPPIRRCAPGEEILIDVFSSHFSRRKRENVTLQWRLSGIDSLGWLHDDLASGSDPITFSHLRVELAKRLRLRMPNETMLCTLWVRAYVSDGTLIARNYTQFFVDGGCAPREDVGGRTVLRLEAHSWETAEWKQGSSSRDEAVATGTAHGISRGFFEWKFPFTAAELRRRSRITVFCEASAFGQGRPQTDSFAQPTALRMLLNGVPVYQTILPNHPHDARGALSYLRGGRGAYGYLNLAKAEGSLFAQVLAKMRNGHLRLRCLVPKEPQPQGGLTIYGSTSGRYPVPPTLVVE